MALLVDKLFDMEIWQIILSSALVTSILSSVATWLIGNHAQNKSFKYDYYKLVINKRMEAYQYVDNQIKTMKFSVLDDDGNYYHSMFYGDSKTVLVNQRDFMLAKTNGIWLSSKMENALTHLNQLLLEINKEITDDIYSNVLVGKKYYTAVVRAREHVENLLKQDMLTLYDVEDFLKEKKKSEITEIKLSKANN